jgi:hypothetical protein
MQEIQVHIQVSIWLDLKTRIRVWIWTSNWTTHRFHSFIVDTCQGYNWVTVAATVSLGVSQLLMELHSPLSRSTLVYCDNVSIVYLASNPIQHQRTKHVEIDIHFIHDTVALRKFTFCTSQWLLSSLTCLPRACHLHSSSSFTLVSTSVMPRVGIAGVLQWFFLCRIIGT